jgi:hypothetical protein
LVIVAFNAESVMVGAPRQRQQTDIIRIYNRGVQTVSLQVKPPNGDFYLHEQQVHVAPGKSVMLPKDHVRMDQVVNLAARGMLKVTYDSETVVAGQR